MSIQQSENHCISSIGEKQELLLEEWRASGVDDEITLLNARWMEGWEPYEYLFYFLPDSERRNDGRIRFRWLNRYRHVEYGGWWCSGVDPITGERREWGQFKPDKPRGDIKYESSPGTPTEPIFLEIPNWKWIEIAKKHGKENKIDQYTNFWEWVIEENIPIIITEGVKKAGALLTAGHPAISLPGIWNFAKKGTDELKPDLDLFANRHREVYFAFDSDIKPKTITAVDNAILKAGRLFDKRGCNVRVIKWNPDLGKGVDDLLYSYGNRIRGENNFIKAYESTLSLYDYELDVSGKITLKPDIRVNQRYLGDLTRYGIKPSLTPDVNNKRFLLIKSPKGTGKTESISKFIQSYINNGDNILVLGHRRQLTRQICNKFGISYIDDIRDIDNASSLGLCVDSLYKLDPEKWKNAIIVIDEVVQVVWHTLNSNTEVKKHRLEVLESFAYLIVSARQIILADADLNDITIDLLHNLAKEKYIDMEEDDIREFLNEYQTSTWLLVNEYKDNGYPCEVINSPNPSPLVTALLERINNNERILIQLTAQDVKSKWSTQAFELFLNSLYPDKKILRIDSETIADPNHEAYLCISDLNNILLGYDIVIASPTIETGVSIDIKNHFGSVFAILNGVQTVDAAVQSLSRVREPIPRYVWVNPIGIAKIGDGSTNSKGFFYSNRKLAGYNLSHLKAQISDLANADSNLNIIGTEQNSNRGYLHTWSKIAATINQMRKNYRDTLIKKLTDEGNEVSIVEADNDEEINELFKDIKEGLFDSFKEKVVNIPSPSSQEYDKIKDSHERTEEERHKLVKGDIERLYLTEEVTKELVDKHSKGFYPKIKLNYYLGEGSEYLPEKEIEKAKTLIKKGKLWHPDFNDALLNFKVIALSYCDIPVLIELLKDGNLVSSSDKYMQELAQKWKSQKRELKDIFGISITDKDSPIAIAQMLLRQIGYKLVCVKQAGDGRKRKRVRLYSLASEFANTPTPGEANTPQDKGYTANTPPNKNMHTLLPPLFADGREEIFQRWYERDKGEAEQREKRREADPPQYDFSKYRGSA